MTTEILIHRCTLRLVRHGGLGWGPDRQRLQAAATRLLPQLLAQRLAELLSGRDDLEISVPLRLTVSLRLAELLTAQGPNSVCTPGGGLAAALDKSLTRALGEVAASPNVATAAVPPVDTPGVQTPVAAATSAPVRREVTLRSLLLDWRSAGRLALLLEGFAPTALVMWHDTLFAPSSSVGGEATEEDSLLATARRVLAALPHLPEGREARLRLRIILAVELLARHGAAMPGLLLERVLDLLLPLAESPSPPASPRTAGTGPSEQADMLPADRAMERAAGGGASETAGSVCQPDKVFANNVRQPRTVFAGDVQVCSVLPFLVLGVLSRIGYLEVLTAALQAARLEDEAAGYAVALAHKVLPPPLRGWRREPVVRVTAAAFAGLAEALPEPTLMACGRRLDQALSPLDAFLARFLCDGHDPNQPLLLWSVPQAQGGGLLLIDTDGCFPVAWRDRLEELLPVLGGFGPVSVLIPKDVALPGLLRQLDGSGIRFVTDAPPGRGELWRALAGPVRGWSNDGHRSPVQLARLARRLPLCAEAAAELAEALIVQRPALAPAPPSVLERSTTLAAAAALGTIAWTLWREREAAHPMLALDRFGDLDGRVDFTADSVRVRVPLGRRHQDLRAHGFLADIAGVPWLDGRVVEFPGM